MRNLEFNTGISGEYKVEAICNIVVYVKKLKNYLLCLY